MMMYIYISIEDWRKANDHGTGWNAIFCTFVVDDNYD